MADIEQRFTIAQIHAALASARVAVFVFDAACELVESGRGDALGIAPDGRPAAELVRSARWLMDGVRRALDGATCTVEGELGVKTCEARLSPLASLRDERAVCAVVIDVTERREKLAELESKTRFFANATHELRTPLTLIMGLTSRLLAERELAHDRRHDLEGVRRNCRVLLGQVNDLLDVAKLEAGKLELHYLRVDLASVFRKTAARFEVLAAEKDIPLAVDAPPALSAEIDADKVQRVIANLLSNALKFTPRGRPVRASLRASSDGKAVIEVADGGPGVPTHLRDAVFGRFYQIEPGTSRATGGTGLGLAIARELTLLHHGTIRVEAAPEGGALFHVEVPLAAPRGARVRAAAESPDTGEFVPSSPVVEHPPTPPEGCESCSAPRAAAERAEGDGRPLVLVVEDDPQTNQLVAQTIGDEYRVASAYDGSEGLAMALALKPDLVLTDMTMPAMTGEQLLREIRARHEIDQTPVMLLTGRGEDELRVRVLRSGAQDYVTKPFLDEELRARVQNVVTMKRLRDLLQREVQSRDSDVLRLTRELAQRKRELVTALASAEVAREHAERATSLKMHLLGLVSHELRTPLTILRLHIQMLQREAQSELSPAQREHVGKMAEAASRLRALIEMLLEYANVELGRVVPHAQPFDLVEVARDVVDELHPQADRRKLVLRFEAEEGLPPMDSDPRLVRLVLFNLVDNAIKFTERGEVLLRLTTSPEGHRIAVSDTGPGIAPSEQMVIFEPFEHLEPMRLKHTPGMGLGLALVRELCRSLGGRIEIASRIGAGSTFTAVLPGALDQGKRTSGGGDRSSEARVA